MPHAASFPEPATVRESAELYLSWGLAGREETPERTRCSMPTALPLPGDPLPWATTGAARGNTTPAGADTGLLERQPARTSPRSTSPPATARGATVRWRGTGAAMLAAVGEIVVVRDGSGPEVLLVHGGAGPRTTWGALAPLADRWTLAYVHRRGYPPSPPPQERQDFEVDAHDLEPLLVGRPHVVAHSYGVLGTLIAAAAAPGAMRSLTLIEPPLNYLVPDDPDVARLERIGDAVLTHGMDTDPTELREFLRLAGAPIGVGDGPLPEGVIAGVRRAHGSRPTSEARPRLDAIRRTGVPVLVASGDHSLALERICDALADALGGERGVHPGAGHFVAAAPGFTERLETFLRGSTG